MKTLVLAALSIVLAAAPATCQQVLQVRSGFAACQELTVWRAQEAHRIQNPQGWYPVVRRMLEAGQCWMTRPGQLLQVQQTRHPRAVVVRRLDVKGEAVWWIAREAFRWK